MKTHIHFLLDRSGSMASMAGDVIGGFNQFLHEQKENGTDAVLTLVQFDSQDAFNTVGYAQGSVQAFAPDGVGAGEAFASLSRSTASLRDKVRRRESVAPDQFFEDKAAEADRATGRS